MQTRLAPIPVDQSLRAECVAPTLPEDPVTPSTVMQFSREQEERGLCERARANGLLRVIDAHNNVARETD